jgi:hypothetical protein
LPPGTSRGLEQLCGERFIPMAETASREEEMDRDPFRNPALQSGYAGDEGSEIPPSGPPVNPDPLPAEQNRGRRAPAEGSGVVVGSGAAAGGGGAPEDFDADPHGGGGAVRMKYEKPKPAGGADAPVGGGR